MKTILASKITLWKSLKKVKSLPSLPNFTSDPNPLESGQSILSICFSPGSISSLNKSDGKIRWRYQFEGFGASSIVASRKFICGNSNKEVFLLGLRSGKIIWKFQPYDSSQSDAEIYSKPILHRDRVYFGDAYGFLYCLMAKTGKLAWKRKVSKGRLGINASPLGYKDLIFVTTTSNIMAAYDFKEGFLAWRVKLPDISLNRSILYKNCLVAIGESSLSFVSLSGKKQKKINCEKIVNCVVFGRYLLWIEKRSTSKGIKDGVERFYLVMHDGKEIKCEFLLENDPTNLICMMRKNRLAISGMSSIDIFSMKSKKVVLRILGNFPGVHHFSKSRIYLSTWDYEVVCLKMPSGS